VNELFHSKNDTPAGKTEARFVCFQDHPTFQCRFIVSLLLERHD
jgi:hypothetical protein